MADKKIKRIAVFASGRGSNFLAIWRAIKRGYLPAQLKVVISDNPSAGVIEKARKAGIKVCIVSRQDFANRQLFEEAIIKILARERVELIILAGFMRLLSKRFVRRYKNRILNIHPALLPAFKGRKAIKDAFWYGVKVTGVTVHFVDEEMDHGPIILQKPLEILPQDNLQTLEARIHRIEHRLYPEAIRLVIEGKTKIVGRKVLLRNLP